MARYEITKTKATEYAKATKKQKGLLLDQICEITGWCRDNARKQLKRTYKSRGKPNKKKNIRRPRKYSFRSRQILVNIWVLSGTSCGQYLVVQIRDGLIERLIYNKELRDGVKNRGKLVNFGDAAIKEIKQMSSATIDRYLTNFKKHLEPLSKATTKKAQLSLRNEIPFGKSYTTHNSPGWLSTDTVAHCGSSSRGDYIWTLNSTDVVTGWTETISVKNKASIHIKKGHEEILPRFPFKILGVNYDGGSEFINREMIDYSQLQNYIMTRSRPYHSNDNAHVEQKNGDVVRRYAFRYRYSGDIALEILNDLWSWVNLKKNYLTPTKKCIGHTKTKSGRTRGIYDTPKSPARRILEYDCIDKEVKEDIKKTLNSLNDAYVNRRILDLQDKLLLLAKDGTLVNLVQEVKTIMAT